MDKETLSNYGWIVICVLVLAVMVALATPFGTYVSDAVENTTQGLFDVEQNALDAAGITIADQSFEGDSDTIAQTPEELITQGIIPDGGTYALFNEPYCQTCSYYFVENPENLESCYCGKHSTNEPFPEDVIYKAGDRMPTPTEGDTYTYGDYIYTYSKVAVYEGWNVLALDKSKIEYGTILENINGEPISRMTSTFHGCENLTTAPTIPSTVKDMQGTFSGCTALTGNIEINVTPEVYNLCFNNTVKDITLSGSSTILAKLAATSSKGNVKVAQ